MTTENPATAVTSRSTGDRMRDAGSSALRVGGVFIVVLVVMAGFALLTGGKSLIPANLLGMLRAMSSVAILGMGLLLVIVVGEIDLSFGYLYGLSASTIAVAWIMWGWPVWAAIILAFVVAIFWGCFNAFFTTVVKIPSFIATLGSGALIYGFTLYITNTATFNPAYPPTGKTVSKEEVQIFTQLSNQKLPFDFPMQGIWMIIIAIIVWFLLSRSLFGFRLKAIGGNPEAARLARLPVRKYKFAAFIVMGLLACTAATLDFSFIGSTQPNGGISLLFPTFSAVIIGGASLAGGRGSVAGTLTGALLLAVLVNGLALLAAGPFATQMLFGTVTIGAVVLDRYTQRKRGML
jgi:ribose/xylose/arabinose/galactoside ABC-type transport system permease subunit